MSGKFNSPDKRNNRNHRNKTLVHPSTEDQHAGELTTMPSAIHQLDKCFAWNGRITTSNGTWVIASTAATCQLRSAVTEHEYPSTHAITVLGPTHDGSRCWSFSCVDAQIRTANSTKRYPARSASLRYLASASSDGSGHEEAIHKRIAPKASKVATTRTPVTSFLSPFSFESRLPWSASGTNSNTSA